MADLSILPLLVQLIKQLPVLLQIIQILTYVVFVLFFGSIIIRGFRGYLPWHIKLIGRVGFGFMALICAIALAPFIPFEGTGIYRITYVVFQVDLIIASIISTIALTFSVFLISHGFYNVQAIEKAIEKLKMRLEKANASKKDMEGKTIIQNILQPVRIVGIAVLAVFLIIAFIGFKGFPDQTNRILSAFGLNQNDFDSLIKYIEMISPTQPNNMPEGCMSPIELAQSFNASSIQEISNIINQLPIYTDSGVKSIIESNSGEKVLQMYRLEYNQRVYALASTDKQSVCSATGTEFCGCINFGSL